jgi:hypothetical protein
MPPFLDYLKHEGNKPSRNVGNNQSTQSPITEGIILKYDYIYGGYQFRNYFCHYEFYQQTEPKIYVNTKHVGVGEMF